MQIRATELKNSGVNVTSSNVIFPGSIFQNFLKTPALPLTYSEQVQLKSNEIAHQINLEDLQAILKLVMDGHLVEVEKCLQKNPDLVHAAISATDRSGRKFTDITGFQYAVWALDIEMCDVFMKHIDNQTAAIQIMALETEPQKYSPFGVHYDMTGLIEKTNEYVHNFYGWDHYKRCDYWKKEVGGEQRKCPSWLIYAWCEEGKNVAWLKCEFVRCKVIRHYDNPYLYWFFSENYNGNMGEWSTWPVVRGLYECSRRYGGDGGEIERRNGIAIWSSVDSANYDSKVILKLRNNRCEALNHLKAVIIQNFNYGCYSNF